MAFRQHNRAPFKNFRKPFILPPPLPMANPNRPAWLKNAPDEVGLVFFDFETTGGNPSNSALIEIAAVKYVNGAEVARFDTLVNPKCPIPSVVQKITGINNEMVKSAPYIEDVFHDFHEFIGNSIVIAHGAQCDVAFLAHFSKELKKKSFDNFFLCTHLLVANFLPNIPSKSLGGVAQYFNIDVENLHTALDDALVTASVFWKIYAACEKNGFKTIEDLLKIQADTESFRKLGPGINPEAVESAPTTAGLVYLLNSHHEISYISATQNIKKSISQATEIGQDREFNRIIVDSSGFKFERTAHFLEALLREKKELQKLSLVIDPRKVQNRSDNFVQLFIPEDMVNYSRENAKKINFPIPDLSDIEDEENQDSFSNSEEEILLEKEERKEKNLYALSSDGEKSSVIVTKSRRISSLIKTVKFKVTRTRSDETQSVSFGDLKEGMGYCFGPFVDTKAKAALIEELKTIFPIDFDTFSMWERFENLRIIVSILHGRVEEEIQNLQERLKSWGAVQKPVEWLITFDLLKKIKDFEVQRFSFAPLELPLSGLALISNNDFKEFDVLVVVRSRVVKKLRLPFEQGEKLKSSRFFTRLFAEYYDEITSPLKPIVFTDDIASDMELFSYWRANKKGEGEWIDFAEIAPLYAPLT